MDGARLAPDRVKEYLVVPRLQLGGRLAAAVDGREVIEREIGVAREAAVDDERAISHLREIVRRHGDGSSAGDRAVIAPSPRALDAMGISMKKC